MRRRLALGAVATLSTVTLIAGCGSSSSGGSTGTAGSGTNNSSAPPKTELTTAFHALTTGQSLTTTLGLDTDSANLIKITGEHGDTPVTQSQADLLTSAKISIALQAPSGKTLAAVTSGTASAAAASSIRITGAAGGTTYFTLTVVNKNIYLQADLKGILDAAGQSAAYTGIESQVASLPTFATDFIAGKTIEIPESTITALTGLLQGSAQSSAVPNPAQIATLISGIENAVLADLTVTRATTGTTDTLQLNGNVRRIAGDVISAVATALPAAAGQLSPSQADSAPNRDVHAEASVTGGALSKLEFDVGQFSPRQADTLPIVATFSQASPDISAPSGATSVSFPDLVRFFTTFASASTSSGSGTASASPSAQPGSNG
jgi:hypothetical protein